MQNKAYNLGAQARDERKKTAIILKVTQCSKKCMEKMESHLKYSGITKS